jgi:hypothetical protein
MKPKTPTPRAAVAWIAGGDFGRGGELGSGEMARVFLDGSSLFRPARVRFVRFGLIRARIDSSRIPPIQVHLLEPRFSLLSLEHDFG